MHLLQEAALNLLTSNGKGQALIIAGGVFLGNLVWGTMLGIVRWSMAGGRDRELEETIAKAISKAEERASAPTEG